MTAPTLTHIGGPTLLIEIEGWRLLTDPTFEAPGRTYSFGPGARSRKVTGPALQPSDLGSIDAVLLSHDHHADNLDDAGRAFLPAAGSVLTTVSGARRLGAGAVGLAAWQTHVLEAPGRPTLTITATPAQHGPRFGHRLVGEAVGFAITVEGSDDVAIWVSGDTVLFDGIREVASKLAVDVAVMHLGAVKFPVTGPLRFTFNTAEAAEVVSLLKPRVVIPVHYEGWSHFRENRDVFEPALAATGADVRWLALGEPTPVD
ncbi:MBL fold metallo-hydrolase [Cellulomonas sp. URHE0023]|uniref:MBL fold metallo-hydrolase n=1 Tax=Cellulomonas sp. URHE0023 TaxID=1380354 RepID=UPI00048343F1|nr:MBL fold metallo-hydrolase [Cellulomonas sp. URHE0023]